MKKLFKALTALSLLVLSTATAFAGGYKDGGYYVLVDSDIRCVNESEVDSWSYEELQRGISEIYARHGYVFSTQKNRDYFSQQSWYSPMDWLSEDDVTGEFNDYEIYNVNFLLKKQGKSTLPGTKTSRPYTSHVLHNSNVRCIAENEVAWYSFDELQRCISEIYARHGYVFSTEKQRSFFEPLAWYSPDPSKTEDSVQAEFNEYEIYNVNYLLQCQGKPTLPGTSTSRPANYSKPQYSGKSVSSANGNSGSSSSSSKEIEVSGTFEGFAHDGDSDRYVEITLTPDLYMDLTIDGDYQDSYKLEKIDTNTYRLSGYVVCLKLREQSLRVYAEDGRDAKIPFGGTYTRN